MIEPSDQERSELPETTAKYIEDLEQDNERLRDTIEVALEDVVTLRVLGVTNLTSIRELIKKALEADK